MKRTALTAVVPFVVTAALVASVAQPASPGTAAVAAPHRAAQSVGNVPAPPVISASTATTDANATLDELPVMGDYRPAEFAARGKALDPGLEQAVRDDLGVSTAEYLAEGAAAAQASTVLSALTARDAGVLGGRVSGTRLTVYVATEPAAKLARSVGAQVVYGPPPAARLPEVHAVPMADQVRGGQPYLSTHSATSTTGELCSVGFIGRALAGGAAQLVTAGHCADPAKSLVRLLDYTKPSDVITTKTIGATLGTWLPGSTKFGGGHDSSLLTVNQTTVAPQPAVLTWGGGSGAPLSSAPVNVTTTTGAVVGAPICKSGGSSGWSCGKVLAVDVTSSVYDEKGVAHAVNSIATSVCVKPGDSGGAALIGTAAAGVTSWAATGACSSASYLSGFAPMVSSKASVMVRLGSTWEPSVVVTAVPAVTSLPGNRNVFAGGTISGTAAGAVSGDYVKVQFSGESKVRTASIVNGAWAVSLAGLAVGAHSYTIRAAWGKYSLGPASSGTLTVVPKPAPTRHAGGDRYATSVAISKAAYPGGAKIAYVATGENYPDALSAGPVAAAEQAPLLLTSRTLPGAVRSELARLKPAEIVVVGGERAVPASVVSALRALAPKVTRIAGSDRYDTSRRLVNRGFPVETPTVYLATGSNFPDALAAGAAAGAHHAPVLLVKGTGAVDATTRSFLAGKHTRNTIVLGGAAAISSTFSSSLSRAGFAVSRLAGADRFATSEVIGRLSFRGYRSVYFATGYGFPDALAGSAVAGAKGVPLFTVPGTCVPGAVVRDLLEQGTVRSVVLLGGRAAISDAVGRLTSC